MERLETRRLGNTPSGEAGDQNHEKKSKKKKRAKNAVSSQVLAGRRMG
jgi:hypothetical protein